jgi:hypothetical protein
VRLRLKRIPEKDEQVDLPFFCDGGGRVARGWRRVAESPTIGSPRSPPLRWPRTSQLAPP